jgi:riboflavin biosynthesis pyrimidine reductase
MYVPESAPPPAPADHSPTPRLVPHWPVEPIWAAPDTEPSEGGLRGGPLPPDLRMRYAAPLEIPLRADRPTLIANFVSTLDGVVALDGHGHSGGREISGGFEPDRFVMGLLRAASDAVLVGAGTVRASGTHGWMPGHVHPASLNAFAAWRRTLGLAASPVTLVVTASGAIHPRHLPTDADSPVILVTTKSGARRLRDLARINHVEIAAISDTAAIPVATLMSFLDKKGYRLVLSEGGPAVFGQLLAARLVDEVFLTLAPQLAGRSESSGRLGLVEGVALAPEAAAWARLRSVMRSNDHLFLRYQLSSLPRKDLS